MNKALTIVLFFCGFVTFGQNSSVRYEYTFHPKNPKKDVEIEIESIIYDGDEEVQRIVINTFPPIGFYRNQSGSENIRIKTLIISPSRFIPLKRVFNYSEDNVLIELRRKDDVYWNLVNTKGSTRKSRNEAINAIEEAIQDEIFSNNKQKMELYKKIIKFAKVDNNVGLVKEYYERVPNEVGFEGISEDSKKVFWQERLDFYLQEIGYTSLNYPVRDIENVVMSEDGNVDINTWNTFVNQYSEFNQKESPLLQDAIGVSNQFKIVGKALNRL